MILTVSGHRDKLGIDSGAKTEGIGRRILAKAAHACELARRRAFLQGLRSVQERQPNGFWRGLEGRDSHVRR